MSKFSIISQVKPTQLKKRRQNQENYFRYIENVLTEIVEGMLSISFYERYHALMEKSIERSIIIKLLGRKIGFNASLNKIYSLWKQKQLIQLMDLENDYYMLRFQYINDYNKVLSKGA